MGELWLGVLLILGIDLLLVGFVGAIVFVGFTSVGRRLDRRQERRFAEAVARLDFEGAESAARGAFQPSGRTDLPV